MTPPSSTSVSFTPTVTSTGQSPEYYLNEDSSGPSFTLPFGPPFSRLLINPHLLSPDVHSTLSFPSHPGVFLSRSDSLSSISTLPFPLPNRYPSFVSKPRLPLWYSFLLFLFPRHKSVPFRFPGQDGPERSPEQLPLLLYLILSTVSSDLST